MAKIPPPSLSQVTDQPKSEPLGIRITEELKISLSAAGRLSGMSYSDLIRDGAAMVIEKVRAEHGAEALDGAIRQVRAEMEAAS